MDKKITDINLSKEERVSAVGFEYANQKLQRAGECQLCGNNVFLEISHTDRYGFPANAAACTNCGLTFLNPRMDGNGYSKFYEHYYRPLVSAYYGRLFDAKTIQKDQLTYTDEVIELLNEYLADKPGMSFLDIGGSTGIVAMGLIKKFNVKATILDPAPDEIAEANNLGLETITSLFEDWNPGKKKFDLVGMFQTVDHLLDINNTFEKIRNILTDNGLFIIDIVDFRHNYLKFWSTEEAVKIDHPFYFTDNSFEKILKKFGFKFIKKSISKDKHLVMYVCKLSGETPNVNYNDNYIEKYFEEIRYVQSTKWMKK
ncbi:MAG TPA: methyltransferase domain-containing protein [Ignavibacteria bacterium]|nr:methyltransferase domain-containing protein [Ignavibacteria bacterium]